MPILENTTDYATGGQVTAANLNALTETAKFVKSTGAVASTGNTTDEVTLDINANGELIVKALGVDTAQLAADCIDGTKIGDDVIDSEHYVAGSIDNEHLAANSVDSDQYVDGSIDHVHLANDAITGATDHSGTNRPDDEDELLVYDNSAGDLVKMSLDVLAKHPSFPQAYGRVSFEDGVTTITGGYNTTSAADGGLTRAITLAITMADTNYTVVVTEGGGGGRNAASVTVDSTTQFTITMDSEASGLEVHFAVFGTRAES